MGSPPNKTPDFEEQWLVDACTAEIRVHRLIFLFVLSLLLGLWLPYSRFYLALSLLIQVQANSVGKEASDSSAWLSPAMVASIVTSLGAASFGLWRERRRLIIADKMVIAGGMKIPERQGPILAARIKHIWDELRGGETNPPRLICQPFFDVRAHAYDNREGQAIEVSVGLASRVVGDDPLGISILRHEVAHLVYGDLPVIRRLSIIAGAAIFSLDVSVAICLLATTVIIAVMDFGRFPLAPTFANIVSIHFAILLAAFIVMIPLLLGRFILRRYAGFIVALIEMRADVSSGIWGEGLESFSNRLRNDPSVPATTIRDVGLAYTSPSLSHLPVQERVTLLLNPGRLATPKLRYFAVAIGAIWLLPFQQGRELWDLLPLTAAIAIIQALTVQMVVSARGHIRLKPIRAASLAFGVLALQALPFISIEGLAYLAEHLTAAIASPGGFGNAGNADYMRDTIETFHELGRFTARATGGVGFGLSVLLTASSFWLMSRLPASAANRPRHVRTAIVSVIAAIVSIVVSYSPFQSMLYWPIRHAAFASSDSDSESPSGFWGLLPTALRHLLSKALWNLSDFLHAPPALASYAWLRLALPILIALLAALLIFGKPRSRRKKSAVARDSDQVQQSCHHKSF